SKEALETEVKVFCATIDASKWQPVEGNRCIAMVLHRYLPKFLKVFSGCANRFNFWFYRYRKSRRKWIQSRKTAGILFLLYKGQAHRSNQRNRKGGRFIV